MSKLIAKFGLPEKVIFCKKCTYSNQIPSSYPEFQHKPSRACPTLPFDRQGICDACKYNEIKQNIDWDSRKKELIKLLDQYRRNDGYYDCIVPGSGGKDSAYQAHILKYEFGMNPLTVTWPPIMYTDYGKSNFDNWLNIGGGFDNISFKPNTRIQILLTRLSILNLLHPFQTFILGQKNIGPKLALKYDIPLVFYGENEAEYNNPIADNESSLRDKSFHTMKDLSDKYIAGLSIPELKEKYNLSLNDLAPYLPPNVNEFESKKIQIRYLGYYLKWTPQEVYYYAVENTGFKPRPFRTQGTYNKYNSIDDKIDDLHYYTTFIKFGVGRATYDAAQEIRNKHLLREEGVRLVDRFDGEFPDRYFEEILEYLDLDKEIIFKTIDNHRSPHLWSNINGQWKLRHTINQDGVDD